jgi:glycosyltransferase involved in cell wall biosynthesis
MVSIIIPSRKEPYLSKTIKDLLVKAKGEIEIIAILDGYWEKAEDIVIDPRVNYLHFATSKGMRACINSGVALARGEHILKTDAHCMFDKGFDEILVRDHRSNWVVVPRRYALDPEKWEREDNPKYPVDYMYLSKDLHGEVWNEKNKDESLKEIEIDDLMSSQGSCWFMEKGYYEWLELLDESNYGTFANEFQEIGLKCWLSGGDVKVNKNTWYAHWHKPKSVGRGYSLDGKQVEKAELFTRKWLTERNWHKQSIKLNWLIEKFAPVPTWQ